MWRWLVPLALLAPLPAQAHPHVLIDAHVVVVFDKGQIHTLQMGWKFDPVYSGSLVGDFDQDKSGTLSAKEITSIEREAFQDTRPLRYLTHAKIDGQIVEWPKATDFQVMVHKDSLVYAFKLVLPSPVDPRKRAFQVSAYEEGFYIDVDIPNESAVKLVGSGSEGCAATISEDRDTPLLGGAAYPKKVVVRCAP